VAKSHETGEYLNSKIAEMAESHKSNGAFIIIFRTCIRPTKADTPLIVNTDAQQLLLDKKYYI